VREKKRFELCVFDILFFGFLPGETNKLRTYFRWGNFFCYEDRTFCIFFLGKTKSVEGFFIFLFFICFSFLFIQDDRALPKPTTTKKKVDREGQTKQQDRIFLFFSKQPKTETKQKKETKSFFL
jgi:hypothetical protein